MAQKRGSIGYIGRIGNTGSQVVEAPCQKKPKGGKRVVSVNNGDLRCGKEK